MLCGRGNNGGDGFVVARTLSQRGVETSVFLLGSVADVRGDARTNLEVLGRIGLTVVEITNAQEWELHFSEISECDLIVDAILGTGFHGPLSGLLETVVADVNGLGVPVVAIDLPTGVSADSHELDGRGDRSVDDGHARGAEDSAGPAAGRLARRRPRDCRHRHPAADPRRARGPASRAADARAACASWCRRAPPIRTRGTSAACWSSPDRSAGPAPRTWRALGALRSGAGLVTIATPRSCVPIVAAMAPEYMTEPLDETPPGTIDFGAVDRVLDIKADVIAVGPGLGQSPGTAAFVQALLERAGVPLVLDADALNAFAGEPDRLIGRDGVDVIITPHPGEMARLLKHQRSRRCSTIGFEHATRFRRRPPRPRRAQGTPHPHRRPRRPASST